MLPDADIFLGVSSLRRFCSCESSKKTGASSWYRRRLPEITNSAMSYKRGGTAEQSAICRLPRRADSIDRRGSACSLPRLSVDALPSSAACGDRGVAVSVPFQNWPEPASGQRHKPPRTGSAVRAPGRVANSRRGADCCGERRERPRGTSPSHRVLGGGVLGPTKTDATTITGGCAHPSRTATGTLEFWR